MGPSVHGAAAHAPRVRRRGLPRAKCAARAICISLCALAAAALFIAPAANAASAHRLSGTPRVHVVEGARGSRGVSAPAITVQPMSQSVFSGTRVTLKAAASGAPRPRVHWQVSTNGGRGWKNAAHATSARWSFKPPVIVNGYAYREYRAVFTNAAGTARTRGATVTISAVTAASGVTTRAAPVIATQPTSQTVSIGEQVAFSATASGSPAPSAQWQVSTDGGVSWASSAPSFIAGSGENGFQYRAVFTNSVGSATTSAVTLTVIPASSENWSGYVATGAIFSAVNGTWTVPAVTCVTGASTAASQWVGIDGAGDNTVEQEGIETDCNSGFPSYSAWYEMFGDSALDGGYSLPLTQPVAPGDVISASVSLSGSNWLFTMTDTNPTRPWTSSATVASPTPPPAQISAEWIVEDPEECTATCFEPPLADFSPVQFTGATAQASGKTGPITGFPFAALQIASGATVYSSPGPLDVTGQAFTVTRSAS